MVSNTAISSSPACPINVTLIFSLERHAEVIEAYLRGLERLVEAGGDPTNVVSVASFFVSRVDTEADRRLAEVGRHDLQGKLAIANAKLAYQHYLEVFSGERWEALAARGARPQRCLWASTSTKNPVLLGRPLRRGARRAGHREHDAVRDDRRIPGSRHRARHARRRRRRRSSSSSTSSPPQVSTTTTSRRRSRRRESRSSPTRTRRCSRGSTRSAQRSSEFCANRKSRVRFPAHTGEDAAVEGPPRAAETLRERRSRVRSPARKRRRRCRGGAGASGDGRASQYPS